MDQTMKIAYTMAPGRGDTDLLLQRLADRLAAQGLRTCGAVQINSDQDDCHPCDMDVKVLPDGTVLAHLSIARSCGAWLPKSSTSALENAVARVAAALEQGADILIVNKFGKHEAEGRGFRSVIAEAVSRSIPVIVGLNRLNRPDFLEFSEGFASHLPPRLDDVERWFELPGAQPGMAALGRGPSALSIAHYRQFDRGTGGDQHSHLHCETRSPTKAAEPAASSRMP